MAETRMPPVRVNENPGLAKVLAPPRLLRLILLVTAIYGAAHLMWYWGTSMGLKPVLDGKENLALASLLAEQELPPEPFYRAMLYPLLLVPGVVLLGSGSQDGVSLLLPLWHFLLNGAAHLVSVWLVFRLAQQWCGCVRGAGLAAAGFGLYPVAWHYIGDPLDTTVSTTLFLASVALVQAGSARSLGRWIVAGTVMGLAVLARPHFLAPGLAVLVLSLVPSGSGSGWRVRSQQAAGYGVGLWALLLLGAAFNALHSGDFRVMPWQGAFDFYAANRPGADGRYFKHQRFVEDIGEHENPTRRESEVLYREATGKSPPFQVDDFSSFWRQRAFLEIAGDPVRWFSLLGRKAYYLINDFESYNNKTYAFHKSRSPVLNWNPLGWGLLLCLGAGGLFLRCRRFGWDRKTTFFLGLALSYAAGVILFYASSRFRMPLVPLLWISAAGLGSFRLQDWKALSLRSRSLFVLALALLAAISYSDFMGARDMSTRREDLQLLASASSRLARDAEALMYAQRCWELEPGRPDVAELALISFLNARLFEPGTEAAELAWIEALDWVAAVRPGDPELAYTMGVVYWNVDQRERAVELWRAAARQDSPDALAALLAVGESTSAERNAAHRTMQRTGHLALRFLLDPDSVSAEEREFMERVWRTLGYLR